MNQPSEDGKQKVIQQSLACKKTSFGFSLLFYPLFSQNLSVSVFIKWFNSYMRDSTVYQNLTQHFENQLSSVHFMVHQTRIHFAHSTGIKQYT